MEIPKTADTEEQTADAGNQTADGGRIGDTFDSGSLMWDQTKPRKAD